MSGTVTLAWHQEPEHLTYRLREGWHWSGGKPLRSTDFHFTWRAIVDERCGSPDPGRYRDILDVECRDDETVVVRYGDLYSPFLTRFDCVLLEHATGPTERVDQ